MAKDIAYDEINEAKADMDHIYDRPDPRARLNRTSPGKIWTSWATVPMHSRTASRPARRSSAPT